MKNHGASIVAYELFFTHHNSLSMFTICTARGSALPYIPIYRSASVGRSLAGRPPGGAAFVLMQCVFGAFGTAAGCGQPQPQLPHINKFLRAWSSAMPQSTRKNLHGAACCASPEQHLRRHSVRGGRECGPARPLYVRQWKNSLYFDSFCIIICLS